MVVYNPLPVQGYTTQSQEKVDLVNEGKQLEERCLRYIEKVDNFNANTKGKIPGETVLGRSHIQTGWMWVFRSVFSPQRVALLEDTP